MHKFLKVFEESQINKINSMRNDAKKIIHNFSTGDTIEVTFKVLDPEAKDQANLRIQTMTGVVIKKKNNMSSSTFTIKKILDEVNSYVKTFMLYSPIIESIKLIKKGKVRRSKIYYIEKLYGKSARIKEKK
jgi:large subunit ribosomal protein L19